MTTDRPDGAPHDGAPPFTLAELDAANRDQLREYARAVGLRGYSALTAGVLREALRARLDTTALGLAPLVLSVQEPEPEAARVYPVVVTGAVSAVPNVQQIPKPEPTPEPAPSAAPRRAPPPFKGPLPASAPAWAKANARTRRKWRRLQQHGGRPQNAQQ